MPLDNKAYVKQFLTLVEKSDLELSAIIEGMGDKPASTREEMLKQLLSFNVTPQVRLTAQALPLRTRGPQGLPIEDASFAFQNWRKQIFQNRNNARSFQLLNGKDKPYSVTLSYIKCEPKTLSFILENGLLMPLDKFRDIINLLKENPERFTTNIIRKPDSKGNSWLMLHVEPKTA